MHTVGHDNRPSLPQYHQAIPAGNMTGRAAAAAQAELRGYAISNHERDMAPATTPNTNEGCPQNVRQLLASTALCCTMNTKLYSDINKAAHGVCYNWWWLCQSSHTCGCGGRGMACCGMACCCCCLPLALLNPSLSSSWHRRRSAMIWCTQTAHATAAGRQSQNPYNNLVAPTVGHDTSLH